MEKNSFNKYLQIFLTFFFLVVGWQVIVTVLKIPDWIMPTPVEVILTLFHRWGNTISRNAIATTKIILGGFGIGVIVGIPLLSPKANHRELLQRVKKSL